MNNRPRQDIPGWAQADRLFDMAWIVKNIKLFWPTAFRQYRIQGRGAIVIDTMIQANGGGHPFFYYTQEQIKRSGDRDAQRMVREYNPRREVVIVLLKPKDRVSVYRVRVVKRRH